MASIITLLSVIIITFISTGRANKEFVSVECKTEKVSQLGQNTVMECIVKFSQEVVDPNIILVSWKKGDMEILSYKYENLSNTEKYKFANAKWKESMDVSLLISDTNVKDAGDYTCMVITDSGINTGKTSLKVTAKYSKPTIHETRKNTNLRQERMLTCTSKGGHPKGELHWIVDSATDWTKSATLTDVVQEDGLIQLSSDLPLMPGSTFSTYTCIVLNATGANEGEATFHLVDKDSQTGENNKSTNPSKWLAPVVVIGSLIIGLLLLLVFLRKRSQKNRRQSKAALMGDSGDVPADVTTGYMSPGECQKMNHEV